MVRNTRHFAAEAKDAKESYAVRGTLAQLSDTLTSEVRTIQRRAGTAAVEDKEISQSRGWLQTTDDAVRPRLPPKARG